MHKIYLPVSLLEKIKMLQQEISRFTSQMWLLSEIRDINYRCILSLRLCSVEKLMHGEKHPLIFRIFGAQNPKYRRWHGGVERAALISMHLCAPTKSFSSSTFPFVTENYITKGQKASESAAKITFSPLSEGR
jgi:hypothetical protein